MDVNRIIISVLIIFHCQLSTRCDFTSVHYFSKDLTFRSVRSAMVSTPECDINLKYFYYNYISCDELAITNECEVGQDCFNCPKSYQPKKCHFRLPHNDSSSPLDQVNLKTYGEHIIVDWASKAVVNSKIQLISMPNCFVQDIPVELSSAADNAMRKIVLEPLSMIKTFDVFYIDYRNCRDSGWVRMKYNQRAVKGPECISGLEKSRHKFFMDVVVQESDLKEIILDKSKNNWILYQLKNQSNRASEFHKVSNYDGSDLFDIPRLAMHSDNFGSLCWLPDIEASYNLNCTIFRLEPKFVRNLALEFHYKVRDFELKMADFKRIYALTSSSDIDINCVYDLWIFDINGLLIDGPLRIQGPRCIFTHRLEPRPVISHLNRDKVCVSFVFERSSSSSSTTHRRGAKTRDKQFTVMTECFQHTD